MCFSCVCVYCPQICEALSSKAKHLHSFHGVDIPQLAQALAQRTPAETNDTETSATPVWKGPSFYPLVI